MQIYLCNEITETHLYNSQNVENELIKHGVHGFTLHPVRGRGRYFDSFNENHLIKHIQMEIYAANEQANDLCRLISEVAYSGSESEGLVSVVPVQALSWIHDKRPARASDFSFKDSRNEH